MEDREALYADLVKLFAFVINRVRLYSGEHPSAQEAMETFSSKLERALDSESSLNFAFVEGMMIVNDCSFDSKKTGVQILVNEARRLQIEKLIFEPGLGQEEIRAFLDLVVLPAKPLEDRGGFKKAFEDSGFQHIRLGTARHLLVSEDEEVISKSEAEAAEQVQRVERMEEVIEHSLKGNGAKVELDVERIGYELEKKPREVAARMVQRAADEEELKSIVEGMKRFIEEWLAPSFIEQGRDLSAPISRLARELKKAIEDREDLTLSSEDLVTILERCADAVKLELLTRVFEESGRNLRSLARFLRSKEVRERLREALEEKLKALGVGENEIEGLFEVKEKATATRRSRGADITPEELNRLRSTLKRYEEELAELKRGVTVLEREKQRAADEKERVDNIIRNLGEGLVVVDNDGKIQLINPAAEKLLSMDREKSKGVPISQVMTDEHLLALAKGPLGDEQDRVTKEIELKSLDDETRRVLQASSAVIENEEGKTVGMVSILSDITKQKQLDEMKSKFVAHVSHELRTPLLAIEESLGLLLGGAAGQISADQEKFLSIGQRNISRLSRLINDLLDVAKLEAGKMELRPVSFQVSDLLHYVVESVRRLAESKGVNIEEDYHGRGATAEGDTDRITQVVTNLLGNAIKFTPEGGTITISMDPGYRDEEISPEPCVAVSVKDTGVGVPLEEQERIFRKFEQASGVGPQNMSSTGLGLTIAKEIVELHAGKIWVESKEGEGSTFVFAIPRRFRNRAEAKQN